MGQPTLDPSRACAAADHLAGVDEMNSSPSESSRTRDDEWLSRLGVDDLAESAQAVPKYRRECGRDVGHGRVGIRVKDCVQIEVSGALRPIGLIAARSGADGRMLVKRLARRLAAFGARASWRRQQIGQGALSV